MAVKAAGFLPGVVVGGWIVFMTSRFVFTSEELKAELATGAPEAVLEDPEPPLRGALRERLRRRTERQKQRQASCHDRRAARRPGRPGAGTGPAPRRAPRRSRRRRA